MPYRVENETADRRYRATAASRRKRIIAHDMAPKIPRNPAASFDAATLTFYADKTGKIAVAYQNWDDKRVVLEGRTCTDNLACRLFAP